ncbi:MAG: FMN-binding protein [Spirochaetaceae bacterium]|nr:FMN-binding protein [Spirochaetaceae bacterium]
MVTLELRVRSGRIEDLAYLEPASGGPAEGAFAELKRRVLERQGPDIDAVSGGAWTSRAVRKAVEKALADGGAKERRKPQPRRRAYFTPARKPWKRWSPLP